MQPLSILEEQDAEHLPLRHRTETLHQLVGSRFGLLRSRQGQQAAGVLATVDIHPRILHAGARGACRADRDMPPCPFCNLREEEIFHQGELVLGIWNTYPATPGHAMIVPRRHVESWFDASPAEQVEMALALETARQAILARHAPAGFNVGMNLGETAGQTVAHLHMHLVPRYHPHDIPTGSEVRPFARTPILKRFGRSGIVSELEEFLPSAQLVDAAVRSVSESAREILGPLLEDVCRRGGSVRLLLGEPWKLSGVQVRLCDEVQGGFWRISDSDHQERVWWGPEQVEVSPSWTYCLQPIEDRDGQRELRKVFEELWAQT